MSIFKNTFRIESARLKGWDYSTPWWYYVTINTQHHIEYFGTIVDGKMVLNELGIIANQEWLKTKELRKNVDLDYYVVMPNHIHGIIIINGSEVETHRVRLENKNDFVGDAFDASLRIVRNCLSDIIRGFKPSVTKQIHQNGFINFAWQPRFYDRIIRNEKELFQIRKYIEQNPLKWEIEKNNPKNILKL